MTAEIAILNKSAVALAADSAVTISAGSSQEKIYDSADKLFELSCQNAIGVMINGGMHFMQAPLAVLVKKFRNTCVVFDHVQHAADAFLEFLNLFGMASSTDVKAREILENVLPAIQLIKERSTNGFYERVFGGEAPNPAYAGEDGWKKARSELLSEQIAVMSVYLNKLPDAQFVGDSNFALSDNDRESVNEIIRKILPDASPQQMEEASDVARLAIVKVNDLQSSTGLIIAGFGSEDLFPTLVAFELYGSPGGRLKYSLRQEIDIDRDGDGARVVPFAQKEMVERFLYGLDTGIQRNITRFCKSAVPAIRTAILGQLEMSADDRAELEAAALEAEEAFYDGLATDSFDAIREQSQSEIEDMVEFMPKSEMARMAEALVNLTSIKRRVSRGMETVGGPIDVTIISQAEGFVWVKRKHYFPQELNSRYFERRRMLPG